MVARIQTLRILIVEARRNLNERLHLSHVARSFSKSSQTERVLWIMQPAICWILTDGPQNEDQRRLRGLKLKLFHVVNNYSSCYCVDLWLGPISIWLLNQRVPSTGSSHQLSLISSRDLNQNSRASCTNSYPAQWALTVVWSQWKSRMC